MSSAVKSDPSWIVISVNFVPSIVNLAVGPSVSMRFFAALTSVVFAVAGVSEVCETLFAKAVDTNPTAEKPIEAQHTPTALCHTLLKLIAKTL